MSNMNNYRVVWYRVPDNCISGPYAVAVMRPDGSHSGTRTTCIATAERAQSVAEQYGQSFGTSDITQLELSK